MQAVRLVIMAVARMTSSIFFIALPVVVLRALLTLRNTVGLTQMCKRLYLAGRWGNDHEFRYAALTKANRTI
jgi:hypothetical protein